MKQQNYELPPLIHPLGLSMNAVTLKQTTLFIQSRASFSGCDYDVQDSSGREIIRSKGKLLSRTQRTKFFAPDSPPDSPPIFSTRRRHPLWLPGYYLFDEKKKPMMKINRKYHYGGPRFNIKFANTANDGQLVKLVMKGSLCNRSAEITWNGATIATARKKWSPGYIIGKRRFSIELAPGCDVVLFAVMMVCLDESYKA